MMIPDQRLIGRSLGVQSTASLLLAIGLLLIDPVAAYSSLFGSLAAFMPALFFALLVVSKSGSNSAAFLRTAVLAELGKLLLVALICVAVFVWVKPLAAGWFFASMALTVLSGQLGLFLKA